MKQQLLHVAILGQFIEVGDDGDDPKDANHGHSGTNVETVNRLLTAQVHVVHHHVDVGRSGAGSMESSLR